jgi:predicted DCC family thiol-disulfide oxidoreductase YuxK
MAHGIILFDGVCNLCEGSVRFVLKRDRGACFRFASLQSEVGRRFLEEHGLPPGGMASVVLIEDGSAYLRSDAALRVARRLSGPWRLLWAFRVLPRFVRDGVYDWIASHRYRWFGKHELCELPSPAHRERFLA